jgi:hypothetical protein
VFDQSHNEHAAGFNISGFYLADRSFWQLGPDRSAQPQTRSEFCRMSCEWHSAPARVYRSENGVTDIIIRQQYADQLDELRRAKRPHCILPEDLDYLLMCLPDRGTHVLSVFLLGERNPDHEWQLLQNTARPDDDGSGVSYSPHHIFFWVPKQRPFSVRSGFASMNWAWAGQLEDRSFDLLHASHVHRMAVELEQAGALAQGWANSLSDLLSPFSDLIILFRMDQPIEATILGRVIEAVLNETCSPGLLDGELRKRVRYIRSIIEPEAEKKLRTLEQSQDYTSYLARRLLTFLQENESGIKRTS